MNNEYIDNMDNMLTVLHYMDTGRSVSLGGRFFVYINGLYEKDNYGNFVKSYVSLNELKFFCDQFGKKTIKKFKAHLKNIAAKTSICYQDYSADVMSRFKMLIEILQSGQSIKIHGKDIFMDSRGFHFIMNDGTILYDNVNYNMAVLYEFAKTVTILNVTIARSIQ